MAWFDQSIHAVLGKLKTDAEKGISQEEAARRLQEHGPNSIVEAHKVSVFHIFLEQFANPIVWILLAAMAISGFVGEWTDFSVIAAIVVINAVLGTVQEYRAEEAIEALKKMVSLHAKVLRNGKVVEIDASEVVPGDIILLETGDKVPADARLVEVTNLATQEAALTGESTPVHKKTETLHDHIAVADRKNMAFSGTVITNGRGKGAVVSTGMSTEIGKIAKLIKETKAAQTPLQKKLAGLSKILVISVDVIAALIFGPGIFYGKPAFEMFLAAIALAVAAIPEGLPAVVTVSLALGVQRMAKRSALVRKLPSVETLGACTVICSDKTGTLTHNQMTVRQVFANQESVGVSGAGYAPEGKFTRDPKQFGMLLKVGALCNNAKVEKEQGAWKVIGDPTEAALIVSARKAGIDVEKLSKSFPRVKEIEFTSERKLMTTVHKANGKLWVCTKGAPEVLVKLCTKQLVNGKLARFGRSDAKKVLDMGDAYANKALRVLGFAYKEMSPGMKGKLESDLVFVGLQAMIDPPREEVREAIKKCNSAGIKAVMITGDHLTTAKAIARELGINGKAISGIDLDHITDLESQVQDIAVYARVNPSHKIRIVEAFQNNGDVVAMTGDGVNDAPALKKADLGISMGITGTDVAKEASAMVLADDNFASIVRAVEEGRRIFDNIQKYLAYLLSGNIGEVLVLFLSIMLGLPLPLIAVQILWINLITDGLPALALGVDPQAKDVMQRKPRKQERSIFAGITPYVFVYPLLLTVGVLFLFDHYLDASTELARSVAFTSLVAFELFQAWSCRSVRRPIFREGAFANKWLLLAIVGSFALQCAVLYVPFLQELFGVVPIGLVEWAWIFGIASIGFIYLEFHKYFMSKGERIIEERA